MADRKIAGKRSIGEKVNRKKDSRKKGIGKKIATQARWVEDRPDEGYGILDFWFFIRPHKASQAKERTKEKLRHKPVTFTKGHTPNHSQEGKYSGYRSGGENSLRLIFRS